MSGEQDSWRKLLEGIDFSGLEPPDTNWNVKENVLNSEGNPEKRFTISQGLINLDIGTNLNSSALRWDGNLPRYLIPGQGIDQYMEFIYWILMRLPARLYPEKRTPWHYRQAYQKHTAVGLSFNYEGEVLYKLSREREDKKLAIDFVTRAAEIRSIVVTGTESPLFSEYGYILGVNRIDSNRAGMILAIPMRAENLCAWNPDTLEWILGTHIQKDKLEDLKQAAVDLSSLVHAKAEEAMQGKPASAT